MPSSWNAKPLKRPVQANRDSNCFQAIHKREDHPGLIKSRVEDLLETQAGRGFTIRHLQSESDVIPLRIG